MKKCKVVGCNRPVLIEAIPGMASPSHRRPGFVLCAHHCKQFKVFMSALDAKVASFEKTSVAHLDPAPRSDLEGFHRKDSEEALYG